MHRWRVDRLPLLPSPLESRSKKSLTEQRNLPSRGTRGGQFSTVQEVRRKKKQCQIAPCESLLFVVLKQHKSHPTFGWKGRKKGGKMVQVSHTNQTMTSKSFFIAAPKMDLPTLFTRSL